jgi:hypothetical protein
MSGQKLVFAGSCSGTTTVAILPSIYLVNPLAFWH